MVLLCCNSAKSANRCCWLPARCIPTPQGEGFKSARQELFEQQRAEQLQQPRPNPATHPPDPNALSEALQRAERARVDIIAQAHQYPPDHWMRQALEANRESLEREIDRYRQELGAMR